MFGTLVKDAKVIVEIGSWLGLSARFWLKKASNAHVICIDTWKGSSEHVLEDEWRNRLPTLFETFCVNQWEWRDRVTPIRMKSIDGLLVLNKYDVNPDFIYIDGSHEYADVLADLSVAHSCFPDASLIGDDWNYVHKFPDRAYKTVQEAVKHFCKTMDFTVEANNWAWMIKK